MKIIRSSILFCDDTDQGRTYGKMEFSPDLEFVNLDSEALLEMEMEAAYPFDPELDIEHVMSPDAKIALAEQMITKWIEFKHSALQQ